MAFPSSKRRRAQRVSSQPSTIPQQELFSSHLQASPSTLPSLPPSSVVPSLSQSQTSSSSSQPSGNSSTVQPAYQFPSHARHPRYNPPDLKKIPKKGRGTLKGLKVAKRVKNSDGKLPIKFSARLGEPIGEYHREFVDYVAVQMKDHLRPSRFFKWSEVTPDIKEAIKKKVLERWKPVDDNVDFESKILNIAQRRFRGWMSTFSATYRAYKDDPGALNRNCPEELDHNKWENLISYFKTPDYERISSRNSKNRKKQGSKHHIGSKSLSQVSYENLNKDTQEEPDDCTLWELAHCVKGKWSENESKCIYEEAKRKIKEANESRFLSSDERNEIFQSVRGSRYMAKGLQSTSAKRVLENIAEASTSAKHGFNDYVNFDCLLEIAEASTSAKRVVENIAKASTSAKHGFNDYVNFDCLLEIAKA